MVDSNFSGQTQALTVLNFRPYSKNSLRGQFDASLPNGLILRRCTLHERDGQYWITFPGLKYTAKDGSSRWTNIIDFADEERRRLVSDPIVQMAIAALKEAVQ